MDKKLLIRAVLMITVGFLTVGLFVFLPAGTLRFGCGWLFMGVLFVPMLILGVVLMLKDPELLRKRLNNKEQEATQKGVIAVSALMFGVGFIVAGLDHRFGWSHLPKGVIITAAIIFLASYAMYAEVMRENAYLSRTVEVQENQKVIDTGLYGIVRHPMYFATVLMFLSMPLVLGSLPAFVVFLVYPFTIAARIKNEEKVLEEGLEGYTEYKKKVKYRILPFIW